MSYWEGKDEVCAWVRKNFDKDSTILDMGAYDGNWHYYLPEYKNIDAVEVFRPNFENLNALGVYRKVFYKDARNFKYQWYDLVIFGDIVEHMLPADALEMLNYAKPRCRDMIIAVPFLYKQDAIYGNPYEVHIQDDLTDRIFEERYPGYSVLCRPREDYCYYHKKEEEKHYELAV